jgi:hypothetical protein
MRLRLACAFAAILPLSLVPAAFAQASGARAQSSNGASQLALLHHPSRARRPEAALGSSRGTGRRTRLTISVVSNPHPGLVSGGEVLLRIATSGLSAGRVRVTLGRTDVTSDFKLQPDGTLLGLIGGLSLGRNEIVAQVQGGGVPRAIVVVDDHPITGPVFSGPWQVPTPGQAPVWYCTYSTFAAAFPGGAAGLTAAPGAAGQSPVCSAKTSVSYGYYTSAVPQSTTSGAVKSGSTSITGLAATQGFTIGETVSDADGNIPAGTTIADIPTSTSIVLSNAATGSATEALVFGAVASGFAAYPSVDLSHGQPVWPARPGVNAPTNLGYASVSENASGPIAPITVPEIVRVEEGTIDRGIYQIAALYNGIATPTPTMPDWDPSWNGRLVYQFGGGCGMTYGQGASTGGVLLQEALSEGYAVASNSLNTNAYNCGMVLAAEAAMMTKEHFIDEYGPVAHTIGWGGSGGSIQQYGIDDMYPGIIDGTIAQRSFPTGNGTAWDGMVTDCRLLDDYFGTANPGLWGTDPMTGTETSGSTTVTVPSTAGLYVGDIVYGTGIPLANLNDGGYVDITSIINGTTITINQPATSSRDVHLSFVTASTLDAVEGVGYPITCPTWDGSFSDAIRAGAPPSTSFYAPECSIPAWTSGPPNSALLWNATGNPDGVKCMTEEDYVNQVGANTSTGFANAVVDNQGVEYGLDALDSGAITPAQFIDLNKRIGGFDAQGNAVQGADRSPNRTVASSEALYRYYTDDLNVCGCEGLRDTPMITDLLDLDAAGGIWPIHTSQWSFVIRARLMNAGDVTNQVILENNTTPSGSVAPNFNGDLPFELNAMDAWLNRIDRDPSALSVAKIARDRPFVMNGGHDQLEDGCFTNSDQTVPVPEKPGTEISLTATGNSGPCEAHEPYSAGPPYPNPAGTTPIFADPRLAAGQSEDEYTLACALKPVQQSDYTVALTKTELDEISNDFSSGVCNYSKPGPEEVRPLGDWADYGDGDIPLLNDGRGINPFPAFPGAWRFPGAN